MSSLSGFTEGAPSMLVPPVAELTDPLEQVAVLALEEKPDSASVRTQKYGLHAIRAAIIASEITPVNEMVRYGALAATLAETRNPVVAAAVLGGTTMMVEGAAAIASAEYIAKNKVTEVVKTVADKLPDKPWLRRFLTPKNKEEFEQARPSHLAEAGLALNLGVVAAMEARQRVERNREVGEVRTHGLKVAAFLSGALAVEGAAIAEGIENAGSPWVWGTGLGLLGAAAIKSGYRKLRNRNNSKVPSNEVVPRYDLDTKELAQLESELVDLAKERAGSETVVPIVIDPKSKFANIVRTHEAEHFPEVKELSAEVEHNTVFLAMVDTRTDIDRVVHATTLSGYSIDGSTEDKAESTGFIVADDLANLANFTPQEFKKYYREKGYDLNKCLSVETNFNIGDRVPLLNGMSSADIAYLTIFQLFMAREPELGKATIFASINEASAKSFARIGLKCELLMGRDDLETPESRLGKAYKPIAIPYTAESRHIFESLPRLAPIKV